MGLLQKIFGSKNQRELRSSSPAWTGSTSSSRRMKAKSDAELKAMTAEFKQRLDNGETLDDDPARGVRGRPRGRRCARLGMRHYDVQLIGGMVLHSGRIAEMRTGEGKTLVATLPTYLNALDRQGRPRRHRQRLPRQARRRVDGSDPRLPRPDARA